jgi:hypothetical protein
VEEGFSSPTGPTGICGAAPAAPAGSILTSGNLVDYPRLTRQMTEVLAFAFGCGLTRVATFQMSEHSLHYPASWLGQTFESHNISHYVNLAGGGGLSTEQRIGLITRTTQFWASEFAYFLQLLNGYREGPTATVLDNSLSVLCTSIGDSNAHSGLNAPFVVAGNAGGRFASGRVLDGGRRQHNDLFVSLGQAMGFPDFQTFGDAKLVRGPLL